MKIGLFIPCYVDAVFPEVGMATYKLLTHLGLDVTYPEHQTCCGQPMANRGISQCLMYGIHPTELPTSVESRMRDCQELHGRGGVPA